MEGSSGSFSIHKNKGSDSDPTAHRPIALLNTMYKVYAALIQKRLASIHDHNIRDAQFGFLSHKSTNEPIFIIRRYQDYSAKTGHPAHFLFLDWKQAFDKIDHRSLLIALKRFGVHRQYLDIITDIYIYIQSPNFAPKATPQTTLGERRTQA